MPISFRGGFIGGLAVALFVGFYLIGLWQPGRQVRRHTESFFHAIERKNWAAVGDFIGSDYQDQWGDDRARVLERLRQGFRYVHGPRIIASNPSVQVESPRGVWSGKIRLYSSDDDVMEVLDQCVNSLPSPFELEWHHLSEKPWDWKLARVAIRRLKFRQMSISSGDNRVALSQCRQSDARTSSRSTELRSR